MNRHIIIGFKKGSSFKTDMGELVGLAPSLPEAAKEAKKVTGEKGDYAYCMIINAKIANKIVGDRSSEDTNVISFGTGKPKESEESQEDLSKEEIKARKEEINKLLTDKGLEAVDMRKGIDKFEAALKESEESQEAS
ncbi:MAG: hypothetical protein NE327_09135 [Lentisphaeraceae bacterium]|nr:hypothetical protein [Lentisphaeraceae bacterium]